MKLPGLFILFLLSAYSFGYTMPKGVPNAWIDPDISVPSRPADWSSPVAGYYYVDSDVGNNTGNTYGTPSAPRETIPTPLPAGSYVELGAQTSPYDYIIKAEGTAENPVWIVGAANHTTLMNRFLLWGSYCYVDGLQWDSINNHRVQLGSASADFPCDHIMLRNLIVKGSGGVTSDGYGMTFSAKATQKITNCMVYNCTVQEFGDMATLVDVDNHVIGFGAYVEDFWVLNTTMHTCTAGLQIAAGDADHTLRIYVADCEVYNILQSGIWLKHGTDIVFSSNYVHDIVDTSWSRAKCIGGQYHPQGLWLLFNRLEAGMYGIHVPSTDGAPAVSTVYAIGNTITGARDLEDDYDNTTGGGAAAITFWGVNYRYVVNNTLYDNCAGVECLSALTETHVVNNIISNITEDAGTSLAGAFHVSVAGLASDSNFFINNNSYYDAGTQPRIRWNSNAWTPAELRANTASGEGDIETDPLLTNPATGDFTIPTGSPAKDSGSATLIDSLEASYLATFGVSVSFDKAGVSRPQNGIYDIGAHEFGTGTITATTLNATTLNVGP